MKKIEKFCLMFCSFLFLLVLSTSVLQSQDSGIIEEPTDLMVTAFTLGSDLLWDKSIAEARSNFEQLESSENLLQLCYTYYGKASNCIGLQKEDEGEQAIEFGLAAAERLAKDRAYASDAYALLGGFNGLAIAFSPMKGMFLGPKSDKQIAKALALEAENAIGWLQKGSSQYNTPRMFGGSARKAVETFRKSIQYFDKDLEKPRWMKLEAMIWLGQAYHYLKDYRNAEAVYNEVLALAPGLQWVEKSLLPATLAKLNN